MIKDLHQELAGEDAELDDDDDDPLRRECEKRVKDCEERLKQSQAEGQMQAILLDKVNKELRECSEKCHNHVQRVEALRVEHPTLAIRCSSIEQCHREDEDRGSES